MLAYLKIFLSWPEDTQALKDAERGRLINALVKYARGDENADAELSGSEKILYPMYRNQIDRDAQEYALLCEKRKNAGSKGGKQMQANATKCRQMLPNASKCEQEEDKEEDEEEDKDKGKEDTSVTPLPQSLKKKIDNNYKHSRKARMAVAQVLVDEFVAEDLPVSSLNNLYDHVLCALVEGLSPGQIYEAARLTSAPGEFSSYLLWMNKGKWETDIERIYD